MSSAAVESDQGQKHQDNGRSRLKPVVKLVAWFEGACWSVSQQRPSALDQGKLIGAKPAAIEPRLVDTDDSPALARARADRVYRSLPRASRWTTLLRLLRRPISDALVGLADVVGVGFRLADRGTGDVGNCISMPDGGSGADMAELIRILP
jgi:hypothetical protein